MAFDIGDYLGHSAQAVDEMSSLPTCRLISEIAQAIITSFRAGGKVLLCGNGGSAADAQHFAGELVSRFYKDRPGLPAIALTANSSVVTAIGNDYGYEQVFSRQVAALGNPGDVLWALTTSGNSANVLRALDEAQRQLMRIIVFTGADGGMVNGKVNVDKIEALWYRAPSDETPIVQQCHLVAGHAVCALVEDLVFPEAD